jgi:hypothetical protein
MFRAARLIRPRRTSPPQSVRSRLVYETMIDMGIGSNYQAQGLKLSKHFRV